MNNPLQKIVFSLMDWMTDGALSERDKLRVQVAGAVAKTLVLEQSNRELFTENNRLRDDLRRVVGFTARTEVDKFVTDQTKINDLNFRIQCLERDNARLKAYNQGLVEGTRKSVQKIAASKKKC